MLTLTNLPTATAREVLEEFHPEHGGHTVVSVDLHTTERGVVAVLDCSCRVKLGIDESAANLRQIPLGAIRGRLQKLVPRLIVA